MEKNQYEIFIIVEKLNFLLADLGSTKLTNPNPNPNLNLFINYFNKERCPDLREIKWVRSIIIIHIHPFSSALTRLHIPYVQSR